MDSKVVFIVKYLFIYQQYERQRANYVCVRYVSPKKLSLKWTFCRRIWKNLTEIKITQVSNLWLIVLIWSISSELNLNLSNLHFTICAQFDGSAPSQHQIKWSGWNPKC